MRRSLTTKARLSIFTAAGGICHLCGGRIGAGEAWEVEHVVALAISRDDSPENMRPAHRKCHVTKTAADLTAIAKAKRREAKHLGAKRSSRPMPGSRASGLSKRFNGEVVRR